MVRLEIKSKSLQKVTKIMKWFYTILYLQSGFNMLCTEPHIYQEFNSD